MKTITLTLLLLLFIPLSVATIEIDFATTNTTSGNVSVPCINSPILGFASINCTFQYQPTYKILLNNSAQDSKNQLFVGVNKWIDVDIETVPNNSIIFQDENHIDKTQEYYTSLDFFGNTGYFLNSQNSPQTFTTSSNMYLDNTQTQGTFFSPCTTQDYIGVGDDSYTYRPQRELMRIYSNCTDFRTYIELKNYEGILARNNTGLYIRPNNTQIIIEKNDKNPLVNISARGNLSTFYSNVVISGSGLGLTAATVTTSTGLINTGSIRWATAIKSANYTLNSLDSTIFTNTSTANITLTFPAIVGVNRIIYSVVKIDGVNNNWISINTSSSANKIQFKDSFNITTKGSAAMFQNDITNNWYLLSFYNAT